MVQEVLGIEIFAEEKQTRNLSVNLYGKVKEVGVSEVADCRLNED